MTKPRLSDAEKAEVLDMLAANASREALATLLGCTPCYLPVLMRQNGMGDEYARGMHASRRLRAAQHATEAQRAKRERNAFPAPIPASQERLDALMRQLPPKVERPERTFEEKLALLREGKARLVPNVKIGRAPVTQTSAYGEAMS